jgi:hypothetical protein
MQAEDLQDDDLGLVEGNPPGQAPTQGATYSSLSQVKYFRKLGLLID